MEASIFTDQGLPQRELLMVFLNAIGTLLKDGIYVRVGPPE